MKPNTTFGLKCLKKEEKVLVKGINEFLSTIDRTMSKAKNKTMLEDRLPFVLRHFYWNLNKGVGTWFEVYPNEDLEGKYYSEANKDCGWLITTSIDLTHPGYEKTETEQFLENVLEATTFDYVVIEEKD